MKPKTNRKGDTSQNGAASYDCCQTPMYAVAPLLDYLRPGCHVLEPACGNGQIAIYLRFCGFVVEATDLQYGDDFFKLSAHDVEHVDAIVTNPPYSIKFDWIKHCYELSRPFALLVPLETIGAGSSLHPLFKRYGVEVGLLDKRVDFGMPSRGFAGSSAQFPVIWLGWRFFGQPLTYLSLDKPRRRRPRALRAPLSVAPMQQLSLLDVAA